jgi:phosphotriesterase-related protein
MAAHWIREWENGIEGTGVRPGFMKIGVDGAKGDPPRLSDVDTRIVRAAARAQKRTGLVVASHTGQGAAAIEQIRLFREENADPGRLIIVHCDAEPNFDWHVKAQNPLPSMSPWFSGC